MERRDFWKLGPVWVWKWLVLGGVLLLSLAILAVFGLPWEVFSPPEGDAPAYRYDDERLRELTGTVRVLDARGTVRYRGEVDGGSFTGTGQVFDAQGRPAYSGPLADGVREGLDAKVYRDGTLVYEGEMAQDLYEGQGRRTDPVSGTVSEGQFSHGRLEGEGAEWSAGGALLREGTFSKDLLNGPGKEYGDGGVLLREGTFEDGLLNGQGTQYTRSGALRYQGEFLRGVWQGQGRLYDPLLGALVYEGEFVDGEPAGMGRIYHPSGQLLYEGTVCEGRPRADAFLGLSLAEVEAAFTGHWLLYYAQDGSAAFVYPWFRLMFRTDGPVRLTSLSGGEAQTERKEQSETTAPSGAAEGGTEQSDGASAGPRSVPRAEDLALARDTDKSELVIREVLSYGQPLAGVVRPGADASPVLGKAGWRERFSDFASGLWSGAPPAVQTGPFVYAFPDVPAEVAAPVERLIAEQNGLTTVSAFREDKEGALWYYHSAARKEEP